MTVVDPLPALGQNAVLVTVNKRLAGHLRARYDNAQATQGAIVWESRDILPWGAWLRRAYNQLIDNGHCTADLLTRSQEVALWENVIGRHNDIPLMRPTAAADLASDAFARSCAWSLDISDVAAAAGTDTRVFAKWCRAFRRTAKKHDFIVAAELVAIIQQAYEAARISAPSQLYLAGFDHFTPDQEALLDCLRARGCTVEVLPGGRQGARCQRVTASDTENEIQAAADWAARYLTTKPTARLAVVSPALSALRQPIRRIFTQTLAPGAFLGDQRTPLPFNISLGEPLADKALAAHALRSLRLLTGEQPLATVGQLLRSPFLGGFEQEWEERALLDVELRKTGRPLLGLDGLIYRLNTLETNHLAACQDLKARLERLALLRKRVGKAHTPPEWSQLLRTALKELGWPGSHTLSSSEYQQYERFLELFDALESLGKVRRQLSVSDAIGQLSRLAAETVFQPQSSAKPVQILGILEAAGMSFDAVWLLGMDDRNWPPAPRPNPLLPAGLQRELGMPQASAEHELAFATGLMQGLERSAETLIASYAQAETDQPLLPSPLIAHWPEVGIASIIGDAPRRLHNACQTAGTWQLTPQPKASGAPTAPKGGAALLASQANCPFAAVARYRLQAAPLDEPSHSPDGAMIGSLVHHLLERVWSTLKDSATLNLHNAASLRALVTPIAAAILETAQAHRPDLYTKRFCELETARLANLILAWLDVEKSRGQPFSVLTVERDRNVTINGLELRTRADRVDLLPDGSIAIIDYKTGASVSADGWLDDRLTEPQLPLYAVTDDNSVAATLLARVRGDQQGCRLLGLSRSDGFGDRVDCLPSTDEGPDWATLVARWRSQLDGLAAEFLQGRADPTPSPRACGYCPLGSLCRVQQREAQSDDD